VLSISFVAGGASCGGAYSLSKFDAAVVAAGAGAFDCCASGAQPPAAVIAAKANTTIEQVRAQFIASPVEWLAEFAVAAFALLNKRCLTNKTSGKLAITLICRQAAILNAVAQIVCATAIMDRLLAVEFA